MILNIVGTICVLMFAFFLVGLRIAESSFRPPPIQWGLIWVMFVGIIVAIWR